MPKKNKRILPATALSALYRGLAEAGFKDHTIASIELIPKPAPEENLSAAAVQPPGQLCHAVVLPGGGIKIVCD